jgi:hypothetical protein
MQRRDDFNEGEQMYKLSHQVDGEWIEFVHPFVYEIKGHLAAGVPSGDSLVFQRMMECLEPPYFLLYVLHTPRGEAEPGRYQSPEVSREEVGAFLVRFSSYLKADARFDLWVHSPKDNGTVVWDRHNQLYAYGPTDRYAEALTSMGFQSGEVAAPIPIPHTHHYRVEFDEQARQVIAAMPWKHSPLRPEDEQ